MLKKNYFKDNPEAVRSTAIRPGYQRYTTYYSIEMLDWVKRYADETNVWVTDVIGEALNEYKNRAERRKEKAKDRNR